jgi:hypothetical protein
MVEAVRVGRRPAKMEKDVEAVFDFCAELLTRQVGDATFQAATPCSAATVASWSLSG